MASGGGRIIGSGFLWRRNSEDVPQEFGISAMHVTGLHEETGGHEEGKNGKRVTKPSNWPKEKTKSIFAI